MTGLSDDPLTQLAFSMHEGKGVYAVLIGSGLSRSAEIPTGWEITLDLIRRVALAQGIEDQTDWAAWYKQKAGKEPDYSSLLRELAASPEERRSILHSYIEPSEEDREAGRKVPTAAHRAIAELVRGGYIRIIVTTNFDRLMENALRERGIEPTIVSSVDALAGAEPITHSDCYILKLHGDYKDARILNTEVELSKYAKPYNTLLDRIFDEHGLLVCGWSGEWDAALRAAFLRAPNRRYSVFWAVRGEPKGRAKELISHRDARIIPTADADSLFVALQQRVETLKQNQRRNPLGIELSVSSTKRFLAKAEYRIQLDELFTQETARLIAHLDSPEFEPRGAWNEEEFRSRIQRYEAAAESIASMAGVLGRWGDGSEIPLLIDIVRTLSAQSEKIGSGLTIYLDVRSYPAVLVLTAYGVGATRAERWGALHSLFNAALDRQHRETRRVVESLFLWSWKGANDDYWKRLKGLENRRTPLSDHMCELFLEWGKHFVGLVPDFELLFERFEILGSIAYLERVTKVDLQAALANNAQNWEWMPVGRSGWHSTNAEKLVAELQTEQMKTKLAQAGFAKGDPEFIDLFIDNFSRAARRMRW